MGFFKVGGAEGQAQERAVHAPASKAAAPAKPAQAMPHLPVHGAAPALAGAHALHSKEFVKF